MHLPLTVVKETRTISAIMDTKHVTNALQAHSSRIISTGDVTHNNVRYLVGETPFMVPVVKSIRVNASGTDPLCHSACDAPYLEDSGMQTL